MNMKITRKLYGNDDSHLAMHVSNVSIVINLFLSVGKFIAGILGRSSAMISDAIHSASDVFGTVIAMFGVILSSRSSDEDHQYGHEKQEYIATLFLAFILLFTGLYIGYEGVDSMLTGSYKTKAAPGLIAMIAAVVSIVTKEGMFWYTIKAAKKINSGALRAEAWHHRSDALSSIGSFVGIFAARSGYPIMDPLASVIICIMIIHASIGIFHDASDKLVDHACSQEEEERMKSLVMAQCGVTGIDSLRTRMFGAKMYVDIDIVADGNLTLFQAHLVADEVHDTIEQNFPNVKHCMVHVSPDPTIPAKQGIKTTIACPIGSTKIIED
ncbi:MAG: cation diffusion facilitator family transporter [Acidaminococcus sp.]|jgi:cation diffusion facilitator family transporter|nr:cation diffusion facilitator family transporter [Acidaminococcus sp.]MCI2100013.1 cation diffusion facilitator family transporter [Acidaminococcus sp.]MCI2114307.1 cation diffusion facilitator family transporter [Acidaminococcus sp.]MCI2116916.1 cation diffusion facilitator family transporter [Acidaminococcus sp.]